MAKFDYHKLSLTDRQNLVKRLAAAMAKLRTANDHARFLEQLLTPSEQVMLGRRWQIAQLLVAGESYLNIRANLKVGFTTIEAVDHLLQETVGDYRSLVKKIAEKPKSKRKTWHRDHHSEIMGTFGDIRHRYPLHFLLFNLVLDAVPAAQLAAQQAPEKKQEKKQKQT